MPISKCCNERDNPNDECGGSVGLKDTAGSLQTKLSARRQLKHKSGQSLCLVVSLASNTQKKYQYWCTSKVGMCGLTVLSISECNQWTAMNSFFHSHRFSIFRLLSTFSPLSRFVEMHPPKVSPYSRGFPFLGPTPA
jgi:hypothetical protein